MKLIQGDCLQELKKLEDFEFIGIEKEAEYVEIARARIAAIRQEKLL